MKLQEIIQKYKNNELIFELGTYYVIDDGLIVTEKILEDLIKQEDCQRKKEIEYWNNSKKYENTEEDL